MITKLLLLLILFITSQLEYPGAYAFENAPIITGQRAISIESKTLRGLKVASTERHRKLSNWWQLIGFLKPRDNKDTEGDTSGGNDSSGSSGGSSGGGGSGSGGSSNGGSSNGSGNNVNESQSAYYSDNNNSGGSGSSGNSSGGSGEHSSPQGGGSYVAFGRNGGILIYGLIAVLVTLLVGLVVILKNKVNKKREPLLQPTEATDNIIYTQ